jgi:L-ribulose-5-phosphate 4-epimerase
MDEKGVVKFNCNWIHEKPIEDEWLKDLNLWRNKLYDLGLIGLNKDGIGFGNISVRYQQNQFIITGSATGKYERLTNEHYTLVTAYDLYKNSLTAVGPVIASSESLTHATIYESDPDILAVIHIHSRLIWETLLNKIPTTDSNVEYGTPEMAFEIFRLFKETNLKDKKILVMAGHEEGIVSFGRKLNEAGRIILENLK